MCKFFNYYKTRNRFLSNFRFACTYYTYSFSFVFGVSGCLLLGQVCADVYMCVFCYKCVKFNIERGDVGIRDVMARNKTKKKKKR